MFPKIAKIYILSEEKNIWGSFYRHVDFWFPILSTFENKKYFAITFLGKRDPYSLHTRTYTVNLQIVVSASPYWQGW